VTEQDIFVTGFDPKGRYTTVPLSSLLTQVGGHRAATKRKAFFSFHYADIMRVNNVRKAWSITHPDSDSMRGFYDGSLWESKKLENPESIKTLIRDGVQYTSAVSVLIGTETWQRRWVKYEIARSVIDERGLLAVHINGLNHIDHRVPDPLGYNPLHILGIYKSWTGKFYLYEKRPVLVDPLSLSWQNPFSQLNWQEYQDYTSAIPLPRYLPEPQIGWVQPLSGGAAEYDFALHSGRANIGEWIDRAAQDVGR
jgi:hypothetical protein